MAIFVYVTESCRQDAENHNVLREVEALQAKVEQSQSTSLFDPFPPPYLVKKKLAGRQGRLVASVEPVGEHSVIVFLAFLIRGHRQYQHFQADPVGYGRQHLEERIQELDLAAWVHERSTTSPPALPPDPSAAEYAWLYSAFSHHNDSDLSDDVVFETQRWVAAVSEPRVGNQLPRLAGPIREFFGVDHGLHCRPVPDRPGWFIWAYRSVGALLLVALTVDPSNESNEQYAREVAGALEADPTKLLRHSRRAYPAFILADEDLWIELEKEAEANMALSPEESAVLSSARRGDRPFPLFINGRAGSGKSTVLQYLFSDLLFSQLASDVDPGIAAPIYFTANPELLRVAKSFVRRLLRTNPIFLGSGQFADEDLDAALNQSFQEFQPYLLRLLDPEGRAKFSGSGRVDYPRFRRIWREKFGLEPKAWRECGPDLSWHVIRTYIKGMGSDGLLDYEDYCQLPKSQVSVTPAAFRNVFERVWDWYAEKAEVERLWDDQDLVRYVLDAGLVAPKYPAVFCDEAQDFTRIELELLLRLNLFSSRRVAPSDIHRVQFAFAGDPFQTLNPTGFRWEAIKASFVEKFILELDATRQRGNVDLNYRELEFNYRSAPSIVRVGNLVQAMRAAVLGSEGLRPQVPWSEDARQFPVLFFDGDDSSFWRKVSDMQGFVVLVPCNEGEEAAFVQEDPILSQHIKVEDGVPVNVLSAARAKGCEYPAVIVYGFGAKSEWNFVDAIESGEPLVDDADPDSALPLQYFVNRLYVAVSRPKRRLVIVDSEEGKERLWRFALEDAGDASWLQHVDQGVERWGGHIEGIRHGNVDLLGREDVGDPVEMAKTFDTDGRARRDPFLMRQAAQAYQGAGKSLEAAICRAAAREFDGAFLQAGEAYLAAGLRADAVRCLWRADRPGWARLAEYGRINADVRRETEFEWAEAIESPVTGARVVELMERFVARLGQPDFLEASVAAASWMKALDALLATVVGGSTLSLGAGEVRRLVSALDRMRHEGFDVPPNSGAECYFAARRYTEALELWANGGGTKSPNFDRAKVAIEPYPSRIASQKRLGLHDDIVSAFREQPDIPLSGDQQSAVVEALVRTGQFDAARALAAKAGLPTVSAALVDALLERPDGPDVTRVLTDLGGILLEAGLAEAVVPILTGGTPSIPGVKGKDLLRKYIEKNAVAVRVSCLRYLATVGLPSHASPNLRKKVAEFIKRSARAEPPTLIPPLTVREAGSAIERTGRIVDALEFYEHWESSPRVGGDRGFVRDRWLVVKRRQLERERDSGNRSRASEVERDLNSAYVKWSIKAAATFPEFPEVSGTLSVTRPIDVPETSGASGAQAWVGPIPSGEGPTTIVLEEIKIEYSRQNRRANLSHVRTLETAVVKWSEGLKWTGEIVAQQQGESWRCEAWRTIVRLEHDWVMFSFDSGVKVGIPGSP